MSQCNVERVMNRLLSDEGLRIRFVLDPIEVLVDLYERGMALSADEFDAFVQSDAQMWFGAHRRWCGRTH